MLKRLDKFVLDVTGSYAKDRAWAYLITVGPLLYGLGGIATLFIP